MQSLIPFRANLIALMLRSKQLASSSLQTSSSSVQTPVQEQVLEEAKSLHARLSEIAPVPFRFEDTYSIKQDLQTLNKNEKTVPMCLVDTTSTSDRQHMEHLIMTKRMIDISSTMTPSLLHAQTMNGQMLDTVFGIDSDSVIKEDGDRTDPPNHTQEISLYQSILETLQAIDMKLSELTSSMCHSLLEGKQDALESCSQPSQVNVINQDRNGLTSSVSLYVGNPQSGQLLYSDSKAGEPEKEAERGEKRPTLDQLTQVQENMIEQVNNFQLLKNTSNKKYVKQF